MNIIFRYLHIYCSTVSVVIDSIFSVPNILYDIVFTVHTYIHIQTDKLRTVNLITRTIGPQLMHCISLGMVTQDCCVLSNCLYY